MFASAGAGTAVSVFSVETAYDTAQAVFQAGAMGAGDGAYAGTVAADCTVEHCL